MKRPQSIIWFERLYLLGLVVAFAVGLFNWTKTQAIVAASQTLPSWYPLVMTAVSLILNIVLWYFIARRGSNIARWIYIVLFAFALIGTAATLLSPMLRLFGTFTLVTSLLLTVLRGVCVFLLFRPDAQGWFRGERGNIGDVFR
jgi:hypothetical protein